MPDMSQITLMFEDVCMGLCEKPSKPGHFFRMMIQDALLRLSLPVENLRRQTYDCASNMSGKHNGCQAEKMPAVSSAGVVWVTYHTISHIQGYFMCTICP